MDVSKDVVMEPAEAKPLPDSPTLLLPPPAVAPMATEEYDAEPVTTRTDLFGACCIGASQEDDSGKSWRLVGVGGFTAPELEDSPAFPNPPDVFLTEADARGAQELEAGTCAAAKGAFLLVLADVWNVAAHRELLGIGVVAVMAFFTGARVTAVVT